MEFEVKLDALADALKTLKAQGDAHAEELAQLRLDVNKQNDEVQRAHARADGFDEKLNLLVDKLTDVLGAAAAEPAPQAPAVSNVQRITRRTANALTGARRVHTARSRKV